jgi:hypothetical protein
VCKRCPRCRTERPLDQFYADRSRKDGKFFICKPCHKAYSATVKPRAKRAARKHQLSRYGVTEEQYAQMIEAQRGLCAICEQPNTNDRQLAVDHDHSTGAVRGLLCTGCNASLGRFHDSTHILRRAVDYLNSHAFNGITTEPNA